MSQLHIQKACQFVFLRAVLSFHIVGISFFDKVNRTGFIVCVQLFFNLDVFSNQFVSKILEINKDLILIYSSLILYANITPQSDRMACVTIKLLAVKIVGALQSILYSVISWIKCWEQYNNWVWVLDAVQ